MAILTRRDNREVARQDGGEYRWDPFRVMDALLRWDPYAANNGLAARTGDFTPRFDVKETKNAYVLRADLPGVKESDVDVSVNGNVLTIAGKRDEERREEGEQYLAVERSYGTFARSFSLPEGVAHEGITADLKGGVLTVQVPKKPESQPRKIQVGRGAETTTNPGTNAKA